MDDDRDDDVEGPDAAGGAVGPAAAPFPRPPAPASDQHHPRSTLRIDDAARAETVERLSAHLSAGRLDLHEYEDRVALAYASRTEADLAAALVDLPPVTIGADRAKRRRAAVGTLQGWAALAVLFITIWALTGADYFWPIWPMLGTAIATFPAALAVARGHDHDRVHRQSRDHRRDEARGRRRDDRHG